MTMFRSLEISASGLTAERMQLDVTAENLANAETTRTANGGPYRRKQVALQEIPTTGFGAALTSAMGSTGGSTAAGGVQVAGITEDQTPLREVYDPGHPDADAKGYVKMPNVQPVEEMTNLIAAQRAYEANVTAMQSAKTMFSKTLDLLK
jgi:flagellar basal-body rod protein FlgC